jgi:glycosyltransferase involved in cell wall biosynthesis
MSRALQLLHTRSRDRLDALLQRIDGSQASGINQTPIAPDPGRSIDLLSEQQRWLFEERVDLHAHIDLAKAEDQAKLIDWWIHHMPREYGTRVDEADWAHLAEPADREDDGAFSSLINRLMLKTYLLKRKVRARHDLTTRYGRADFLDWYLRQGLFMDPIENTHYLERLLGALSAKAAPSESSLPVNRFAAIVLKRYRKEFANDLSHGLEAIEENFGKRLNAVAPELLFIYSRLPDGIRPVNWLLSLRHAGAKLSEGKDPHPPGANMIGYAHGAFGMGEHVKMAARALSIWTDQFSIVDVNAYAHERQPEADILEWSQRPESYSANIFHVNADAMAGALTAIGPEIGRDRYNIGYWAWELSKVPEAWRTSIDFVDEIWAPSRFIQDAFSAATDKPVIYMPLCVDLSFGTWKRRSHFSLPKDKFLFLFYFDSYSYYQRKNPFAALRAFQKAFQCRSDVGLVVKTQNARSSSPEWLQLQEMADGDPRIHILNRAMSKGEVLSLQAECDCFVSLHRSEGFGRGPAEAMWLGKPVITTGYSGNMDFTRPDNSLLVDYELIRVRAGEYPFFQGQVWASPDEDHAAALMQRVVGEPGLAHDLGRRGAALMRSDYSARAVGKLYADRLREVGAL